jgi:hypothetical protein
MQMIEGEFHLRKQAIPEIGGDSSKQMWGDSKKGSNSMISECLDTPFCSVGAVVQIDNIVLTELR